MTNHAGVVRSAKGLKRALTELNALEAQVGMDGVLKNMLLTARLITAAALKRKESRGGHFRTDYPETDPALAQRTFMTLADLAAVDRPTRALPADSLAGCRP
jgi:L-aspartate oxidase